MDAGIQDRITGTLVGAAVGDALGAPYEFDIPGPAEPAMIGGGIGPWEPGEWTDDTQLTICVAEAAAAGELSAEGVGARLLAWLADSPKDVRHQIRLVLSACSTPHELAGAAAELYAQHPNASAGNGSLMRAAPVALAHLGDDRSIIDAARQVSAVTHGDPVCGEACVMWCIAIDRAIRERRLDGVDDAIRFLPMESQPRWRAWIEEARIAPPARFVPNGWVVAALQAAYSAVAHNGSFATGLRAAVAVGHDTDTVGAIAGALLGARYRRSAIPEEYQAPLHGWPGLDGNDLAELARRVAP